MTSLVWPREVRVSECELLLLFFLVWPKCNLHVNQISSFVALPDDDQDDDEDDSCWPARATLESFKAATSGNLLSTADPLPFHPTQQKLC